MLDFQDARWLNLTGGYRTKFDPRPLLEKLRSDGDITGIWSELWDELHHQGDIGEASYAAVPHILEIYRQGQAVDWNPYAIVACIESARTNGKNPKVPEWLEDDYFASIRRLGEVGLAELPRAKDPEVVRAILGVIAIAKGLRIHGRFLFSYDEDELLEMESHS